MERGKGVYRRIKEGTPGACYFELNLTFSDFGPQRDNGRFLQ